METTAEHATRTDTLGSARRIATLVALLVSAQGCGTDTIRFRSRDAPICSDDVPAVDAFDGRTTYVDPTSDLHEATDLRGAPNLFRFEESLVFVESTTDCPGGLRRTRLRTGIDGGSRRVVDECLGMPPTASPAIDVVASATNGLLMACASSAPPASRTVCGPIALEGTGGPTVALGSDVSVLDVTPREAGGFEAFVGSADSASASSTVAPRLAALDASGVEVAKLDFDAGRYAHGFVVRDGTRRGGLRLAAPGATNPAEWVGVTSEGVIVDAMPAFVASPTISARALAPTLPTTVYVGATAVHAFELNATFHPACPTRVIDAPSVGRNEVVDVRTHEGDRLLVVQTGETDAMSLRVARLDAAGRRLEPLITIGSGPDVVFRGALLEAHSLWILHAASNGDDSTVRLTRLRLPTTAVESSNGRDDDGDGQVDEGFTYQEVEGTRTILAEMNPIPLHALQAPNGTVALAYVTGPGEPTDVIRIRTFTNGLASPIPVEATGLITAYQSSDANRLLWTGGGFLHVGRTRIYDCVGGCTTYSAELTETAGFSRAVSPLFVGGGMSTGQLVVDGRLYLLHEKAGAIMLQRFSAAGVPAAVAETKLTDLPAGASLIHGQMIDDGERLFGIVDVDTGAANYDHRIFALDRAGALVAGPVSVASSYAGAEIYAFSRGGPGLFVLGSRLYLAMSSIGLEATLHLLRVDPATLTVTSEDFTLAHHNAYPPYPATDGNQLYVVSYPNVSDPYPSVSRYDTNFALVQAPIPILADAPSPASLRVYPVGLALHEGLLVGAANYADRFVVARFGAP